MDLRQAVNRLAQWARRQRQAIHDATSVDDCDLHIASQCVVLQAVVTDNHIAIRIGRKQSPGHCRAASPNEHRATETTLQQQWLVADLPRSTVAMNFTYARRVSTVTTTD